MFFVLLVPILLLLLLLLLLLVFEADSVGRRDWAGVGGDGVLGVGLGVFIGGGVVGVTRGCCVNARGV